MVMGTERENDNLKVEIEEEKEYELERLSKFVYLGEVIEKQKLRVRIIKRNQKLGNLISLITYLRGQR